MNGITVIEMSCMFSFLNNIGFEFWYFSYSVNYIHGIRYTLFIGNLLAVASLDWSSVDSETAASKTYIVVENLFIYLVNW